jgi:uncharacterized protein (TIGR03083 family)
MPTTREQAITILEDGGGRLSALIAGLGDPDVTRPAVLGGGDWSVKDLIGHVAAWERRALNALDRWRDGRPVETLAGVAAIDAFNAAHVQAAGALPLARVRLDVRATHERLIGELRSLSDDDWRSLVLMSNGRRHRLGTLLGGVTGGPGGDFRHAWAHLPDLEAFVASLGR